jgi:TPR repeat protein
MPKKNRMIFVYAWHSNCLEMALVMRVILAALVLLLTSTAIASVDLMKTRELAESGDPWYQTELALMYHNGQGLEKDYTEAARWYRLAAEQGFSKAQANLGVLYAEGLGVVRDFSQAAQLFLAAAEQGSTMAQHNLGLLFSRGDGVEKDPVEACIWLSLAASGGHKEAVKKSEACKEQLSEEQLRTVQRREAFLYLKIEQYKSRQ